MPAATPAYLFSKHKLYNSVTYCIHKNRAILSRESVKSAFRALLLIDNRMLVPGYCRGFRGSFRSCERINRI